MLLAVVMLSVSGLVVWCIGLELLGWLAFIISVGALAVLFIFVLMLFDQHTEPPVLLATLPLWGGCLVASTPELVRPSLASQPSSCIEVVGLDFQQLASVLFSTGAGLVIMLSLVLTLGLFSVDLHAAVSLLSGSSDPSAVWVGLSFYLATLALVWPSLSDPFHLCTLDFFHW
jgi:NADH:ubiquinone oxidoreductase subunit 6 (subunit J)